MNTEVPFDASSRNRDPLMAAQKSLSGELLDNNKVMIPDFPHRGVRYLDFYRTFDRVPKVRESAVKCLELRYRGYAIDAIAGIGSGGFGLGSCLAFLLNVPFHPIRKAGDTVYNALSTTIGMVYAKRELTLAADVVRAGEKIVLVDDTIATGGTIKGAITLLQEAGAEVIEVATLFETTSKGGRELIVPIPLFSVLSREYF